jgi:hypothetical protein
VVAAALCFLMDLDLRPFGEADGMVFNAALRDATQALKASLPEKARSWGLARKCLNIFLRDAFYTCYLRDEYDLALAEPWYEVPLDGVVAKQMCKKAGSGVLPRWLGVKYLTPSDSHGFQAYGSQLAEEMGITRAHLDTYLWVEGRRIKPPEGSTLGIPRPAG